MVKVALLLLLALAACTTAKGSFCAISSPMRLSKATIQTMSEAEVKAALTHNESGRKLCGWTR